MPIFTTWHSVMCLMVIVKPAVTGKTSMIYYMDGSHQFRSNRTEWKN